MGSRGGVQAARVKGGTVQQEREESRGRRDDAILPLEAEEGFEIQFN